MKALLLPYQNYQDVLRGVKLVLTRWLNWSSPRPPGKKPTEKRIMRGNRSEAGDIFRLLIAYKFFDPLDGHLVSHWSIEGAANEAFKDGVIDADEYNVVLQEVTQYENCCGWHPTIERKFEHFYKRLRRMNGRKDESDSSLRYLLNKAQLILFSQWEVKPTTVEKIEMLIKRASDLRILR